MRLVRNDRQYATLRTGYGRQFTLPIHTLRQYYVCAVCGGRIETPFDGQRVRVQCGRCGAQDFRSTQADAQAQADAAEVLAGLPREYALMVLAEEPTLTAAEQAALAETLFG